MVILMKNYSIVHLDVNHIEEICQDIKEQYENGVSTCALFKMTLVPEGNPPVNKAKILCEKYKIFKKYFSEILSASAEIATDEAMITYVYTLIAIIKANEKTNSKFVVFGTDINSYSQGILCANKEVIKDIDVNGTAKLKETLKDIKIVTIFLRVPKEELRRRLENRIDKPSEGEIILRLNRFDYEESKISLYDYVLKNDNLEKTVGVIEEIIRQELKAEQESK